MEEHLPWRPREGVALVEVVGPCQQTHTGPLQRRLCATTWRKPPVAVVEQEVNNNHHACTAAYQHSKHHHPYWLRLLGLQASPSEPPLAMYQL